MSGEDRETLMPSEQDAVLSYHYSCASDQIVRCPYRMPWRALPCMIFNQWLGGEIRVEFEGGENASVPDGSGLLLSSMVPHNLAVQRKRGAVRCRWIHLQFWLYGVVDLIKLLSPPRILPRRVADRLGGISAEMHALHAEDPDGNLLHVAKRHHIAFRFLAALIEETGGGEAAGIALRRLRPVLPSLAFIRNNLGKPLNRRALARQSGLSPTRFHYVFKEIMGASPMAYVNALRMDEARRMLMEEDETVKVIAARCGYSNPFHFSRQFKIDQGLSPLGYRRQSRGMQTNVKRPPPPSS